MVSISHTECVHLKFIKEKMPELELLLHFARQLPTQDIIELINTAIVEKAKIEGKNLTINNQKGLFILETLLITINWYPR